MYVENSGARDARERDAAVGRRQGRESSVSDLESEEARISEALGGEPSPGLASALVSQGVCSGLESTKAFDRGDADGHALEARFLA